MTRRATTCRTSQQASLHPPTKTVTHLKQRRQKRRGGGGRQRCHPSCPAPTSSRSSRASGSSRSATRQAPRPRRRRPGRLRHQRQHGRRRTCPAEQPRHAVGVLLTRHVAVAVHLGLNRRRQPLELAVCTGAGFFRVHGVEDWGCVCDRARMWVSGRCEVGRGYRPSKLRGSIPATPPPFLTSCCSCPAHAALPASAPASLFRALARAASSGGGAAAAPLPPPPPPPPADDIMRSTMSPSNTVAHTHIMYMSHAGQHKCQHMQAQVI